MICMRIYNYYLLVYSLYCFSLFRFFSHTVRIATLVSKILSSTIFRGLRYQFFLSIFLIIFLSIILAMCTFANTNKAQKSVYIAHNDLLYEYEAVASGTTLNDIYRLMCLHYGVEMEVTFKSCEMDMSTILIIKCISCSIFHRMTFLVNNFFTDLWKCL